MTRKSRALSGSSYSLQVQLDCGIWIIEWFFVSHCLYPSRHQFLPFPFTDVYFTQTYFKSLISLSPPPTTAYIIVGDSNAFTRMGQRTRHRTGDLKWQKYARFTLNVRGGVVIHVACVYGHMGMGPNGRPFVWYQIPICLMPTYSCLRFGLNSNTYSTTSFIWCGIWYIVFIWHKSSGSGHGPGTLSLESWYCAVLESRYAEK